MQMSVSSEVLELPPVVNKINFQDSTLESVKKSPPLKEGFLCAELDLSRLRSLSPETSNNQLIEPEECSIERGNSLKNQRKIRITAFDKLIHCGEVGFQPNEKDRLTLRQKIGTKKSNHLSSPTSAPRRRFIQQTKTPLSKSKRRKRFFLHVGSDQPETLFKNNQFYIGKYQKQLPLQTARAGVDSQKRIRNDKNFGRKQQAESDCNRNKKIKYDLDTNQANSVEFIPSVDLDCFEKLSIEEKLKNNSGCLSKVMGQIHAETFPQRTKNINLAGASDFLSLVGTLNLQSGEEKDANSKLQLENNSQSTQAKSLFRLGTSNSFNSDDLICVESAQHTPIFHHFKATDLEKTSNPLLRMKTGLSPMVQLDLKLFPSTKIPKFGCESPNLECDESPEKLLISKSPSTASSGLKRQLSAFSAFRDELKEKEACHNIEDELKKFNHALERLDQERDIQKTLIANEMKNLVDPHYVRNSQPNLTAMMRAILLDWVMEVSAEFGLKRETYSLASSYVDRYLSKAANVEKTQLQLLGATSLYLAIKAEETAQVRITDIATTTDGGYTAEQIVAMELNLCRVIGWRLHLPTTEFWLNYYLDRWDKFADVSTLILENNMIDPETIIVKFLQANQEGYTYFREISQILDTAKLDIEYLQYEMRQIILSLLYLVAGRHFGQFTVEEIIREFSNTSLFLFEDSCGFNAIYKSFLKKETDFSLEELLPSIQFVAKFFILPLSFDPPLIAKKGTDALLESNYENFVSFQAHHSNMLRIAKFVLSQSQGI